MRDVAGTAISRTVVTFARLTRGEPRPSVFQSAAETDPRHSPSFRAQDHRLHLALPKWRFLPIRNSLAAATFSLGDATVQYLRIASLPLGRGITSRTATSPAMDFTLTEHVSMNTLRLSDMVE